MTMGGRIMKTLAQIFLLAVHVLSCAAPQKSWKELDTNSTRLYQQGKYSEGAKVAEEALTVAEKTFTPDHPNLATSLNNLGQYYRVQGRYAEAEPFTSEH